MKVGAAVQIAGSVARVEAILADGERIIALDREIDLQAGGLLPLPPYVGRQSDAEDETRYQTVFAQVPGALAAPTAGLHFTPEILSRIPHAFVTLHVGTGTSTGAIRKSFRSPDARGTLFDFRGDRE